jgi:hypothetical protein
MGKLHPASVAGNPGLGYPDDDSGAEYPEALDRDDEFQDGRYVKQYAPEQGVDSQQDGIEYTDNGGREKAEHGGPVFLVVLSKWGLMITTTGLVGQWPEVTGLPLSLDASAMVIYSSPWIISISGLQDGTPEFGNQ